MRFNEALCQSMPPMHFGLQNNNQLQRSSSELILNEKNESLSHDQENREFYIGRDSNNTTNYSVTTAVNNKIHEHNLNNNLDNVYNQSSSIESLTDYGSYYEESEDQLDEEHEEEPDGSDTEYSEDGNLPVGCRGIVNPNYPGFQHLGPSLLSDTDDTEDEQEIDEDDDSLPEDPVREDEYNNNRNNNNNEEETLNRLDTHTEEEKQQFYEKPKFDLERVSNLYEEEEVQVVQLSTSVKEILQFPEIEKIPDSSKNSEVDELEESVREEIIDLIREAKNIKRLTTNPFLPTYNSTNPFITSNIVNNNDDNLENEGQTTLVPEPEPTIKLDEIDLLANIKNRKSSCDRDQQQENEQQVASVPDVVNHVQEQHIREKHNDEDCKEEQVVPTTPAPDEKKEKMIRNQARKRQQQSRQDNKNRNDIDSGAMCFDVYNIETAMPKIDMDAIENHLKAARQEERRRRTDREEIRRRLAMGPDAEDLLNQKSRKPSLQSRLQSGMNLQICFMNTDSDTDSIHGFNAESTSVFPPESPRSYSNSSASSSAASSTSCSPKKPQAVTRPQVLSLPPLRLDQGQVIKKQMPAAPVVDEADFFARQARLQTEARMALAQAKEMAHMQMEIERQKLKANPITEMVRESLLKIGVNLGEERRRMTRGLITELNIAQLQVLANDLHARIASLNEALVDGLLRRDDLHMEQDSMLVDVEDLTRYLGAKEESTLNKDQSFDAQPMEIQKPEPPQPAPAPVRYPQIQKKVVVRSLAILDRAAAGRHLVANLVRK